MITPVQPITSRDQINGTYNYHDLQLISTSRNPIGVTFANEVIPTFKETAKLVRKPLKSIAVVVINGEVSRFTTADERTQV